MTNLFTQALSITDFFSFNIQVNNILNPKTSGTTGTFFAYLYLTLATEIMSTDGPTFSMTTMTCSLSPSPTSTSTYGAL